MTRVVPSLVALVGASGCTSVASSSSVGASAWWWWGLLAVVIGLLVVAGLRRGPVVDQSWAVPMLDEHHVGREVLCLRVVWTRPAEVITAALSTPDELAEWLTSAYPVASVCEVVLVHGREVVTLRDQGTLSGLQAAELLRVGWITVGTSVLEVVREWPRDVAPRPLPRSRACSP